MLSHLLDGILFGIGFALVHLPLELLILKFKTKRIRVAKVTPRLRVLK